MKRRCAMLPFNIFSETERYCIERSWKHFLTHTVSNYAMCLGVTRCLGLETELFMGVTKKQITTQEELTHTHTRMHSYIRTYGLIYSIICRNIRWFRKTTYFLC